MKTLKKIEAIIIAIMMIAMVGIALADNGTFGDKTNPSENKGTWTLNTEKYTTGITTTTFNVHFETTGSNPSRPKTKFSYSISNGIAVSATGTTPSIYSGSVASNGAVTFTSNSSSTDAWDTVNSNTEIDTISLSFDKTKFPHAGIYRFIITETALTNEQSAIGIEDGAVSGGHENNQLYLDVYVGNIQVQGSNELSVTAAVLLTSMDAPTLSDETGSVEHTLETATYSNKTDGFYNKYTAYNVIISKNVTGDAGDQAMFFPFKLTLGYTEPSTNNDTYTTICGQSVTVTPSTNSRVGSSYAIGSSSGTANEYTDIAIKHGGTVTITGLSKTAVIQLMETIDAGEGYNITSSVSNMDSSAGITTSVHSESNYVTTGTVNGTPNATIAYTNNRESISPTGIVLRVIPYVLMLAAGVVLFLIFVAKRRKHTDEE